MTEIPTQGDLAPLASLRDYAYGTAEEVFYLAQALGPELSEFVGIAPNELQMQLASAINLMPRAQTDHLLGLKLTLGVPLDLPPPSPSPAVKAPVPPPQPAAVNHIPQMPAVRDQAARGTCVAHAAVAVMEHALTMMGSPTELSEQFLYWDCKQNDGVPKAPGTWLRVAFPLIARDGVCLEADWPYQPTPCPREDCGPPPGNAIPAALPYRMSELALPATSVLDIKAQLAAGRCVAFSIPVYRSWFWSALVRATGKINMPVPNDILEGGHAMCLVGYADSNEPGTGGGRFLLRNSWGPAWAPANSDGAGYGTIPYAYIQRYCTEAFSLA